MKLKISYFFIFIFIILIFQNYALVLSSSLDAVSLWLHKVFPFLFIMFVLNDILINLNIASLFSKTTPYIMIMSLLSGAPSNAFIISSLTERKIIDKNSANIYLTFTYFANPLFLYSFLNLLFPLATTIKLIIIHYLANIFIYLKMRKKIINQNYQSTQKSSFNLGKSISKSMSTLLMVLGTITFFLILSNILGKTLNLNYFLTTLLKGFFEVTQGLNNLVNYALPLKLKEIIAISFISFGGLSIHSQVKCFLDEAGLKYSFFLKGRIYQVLIAIILTILT